MLCSNAEGASLKGCNFEDPSGLKANLEGKKFLPVRCSVETEPCACKSVWPVKGLAVVCTIHVFMRRGQKHWPECVTI